MAKNISAASRASPIFIWAGWRAAIVRWWIRVTNWRYSTVFTSKQAQDDYQVHPQHLEFVEKCVRPYVKKVVVYDFQ